MADAEGDGRAKVVVFDEYVVADADGRTETILAVPEELAKPDAVDSKDPRLLELKNPVGADSVT